MDPTTSGIIVVVIVAFSFSTSLVVLLVGCCCFTPEMVLMKVFPYIKESGNDVAIFGFIIPKNCKMRIHWFFTMYVIAWILVIVLFNTFLTVSDKYNPYDGLNCFGYYNNGSEFEVTSEEQAEMDNVTGISCYGWNFDIAGGIRHAAAILTLSWILSSIALWIKLQLYYKVDICMKKGKIVQGTCGTFILLLFQLILLGGSISPLFTFSYFINILSVYQSLDIILICTILLSGFLIIPINKKPKSLAEYCKMAVENRQGRPEEDLEEIKIRVQGYQIQVDLLLELAVLECKKALADIYYYGIKKDTNTCTCANTCKANCQCINTEEEEEAEAETNSNTISEREMKIIAQVAYYKVTRDLQQQNNNQGNDTNTNSAELQQIQQLISDTGAGGADQANESAGLLEHTRNKATYVQL